MAERQWVHEIDHEANACCASSFRYAVGASVRRQPATQRVYVHAREVRASYALPVVAFPAPDLVAQIQRILTTHHGGRAAQLAAGVDQAVDAGPGVNAT